VLVNPNFDTWKASTKIIHNLGTHPQKGSPIPKNFKECWFYGAPNYQPA